MKKYIEPKIDIIEVSEEIMMQEVSASNVGTYGLTQGDPDTGLGVDFSKYTKS